MANKLLLKIRSKDGCAVLHELTYETTVESFLICLCQVTGITKSKLKVLTGFPRKSLDLTDNEKTLKDLGFSSGDLFIVEEIPSFLGLGDDEFSPDENCQVIYTLDEMEFVQYFIPGNNSCLFGSVQFAISNGNYDVVNASKDLRQICAQEINKHPEKFNEVFLGLPNTVYQEWILKEDHWGGAIELSILSKHFQVEIVMIDSVARHLYCFGEIEKLKRKIFILYNGVHYDGFAARSKNSSVPLRTVFNSDDALVSDVAYTLAQTLKPYSSPPATYICGVCDMTFASQSELIAHATSLSHYHFQQTL